MQKPTAPLPVSVILYVILIVGFGYGLRKKSRVCGTLLSALLVASIVWGRSKRGQALHFTLRPSKRGQALSIYIDRFEPAKRRLLKSLKPDPFGSFTVNVSAKK